VPRRLLHILGVRERSDKLVLDDLAPFAPLPMTKRGKPPSQNSVHQIGTDTIIIDAKRLIYAQIRLFSHLRPLTPTYTIVVGEFPLI
jgi:hypothetical protein